MLKKMCKILVVTLCVIALTLPHASIVIAASLTKEDLENTNKINLTALEFHEGGEESTESLTGDLLDDYDTKQYEYIVKSSSNSTRILKIIRENDKGNNDEYLYSDAFYCLDGNDNFPTIEGALEYNLTIEDLFEENPSIMAFSDSTYNSLCWLLNNVYLRKQLTTAQRKEYKEKLIENAFRTILEDTSIEPRTTIDDIKSIVTDDDIEFVQQWAIWYFTNNGESTIQGVPFVNQNVDEEPVLPLLYQKGITLNEDSMENTRYDFLNVLYKYFVKTAESYASTEFEYNYPEIENKTVNCSVENNNYKIGPFKVKSGSDEISYTIKLTDGTNEILATNYIIKNSNGEQINDSINNIFDQEYYLYFPIENNTFSTVKLELKYNKIETNASIWQTEESGYQPVVLLIKDLDEVEDSVSVEIINGFDLALNKFITKVNDDAITNRIPTVKYKNEQFTYEKNSEPLTVKVNDQIEYTIRVYNEGTVAGYASEICDDIPTGLIFDKDNSTNIEYGWVMYDDDGNITTDQTKATSIRTDYLSKEKSTTRGNDAIINAFNSSENAIDCKDIKAVFKVDNAVTGRIITNTAEITNDSGASGYTINDKDSVPDNNIANEDDIDKEKIKVCVFDLSLQKFITKVNGNSLSQSREPQYDVTPLKNGELDAEYTTVKTPVNVRIGDKVTYKIRIYNEGDIDGYANIVADYLPEGLGYLVELNDNINNCWTFESNNSNTTCILGDIKNGTSNLNLSDFSNVSDLNNATVLKGSVKLTSSLLEYSNKNTNNVIKAFDSTTNSLSYKDVEITCVVLDDIGLKNVAEVAQDKDSNGKDVIDRDSDPNTVDPSNYPGNDLNQDDNDVEYLAVKNFDLNLKKFITKVNDTDVTDRVPTVNVSTTGVTYTTNKTPIEVKKNDKITYTIRVYNEGKLSGYAKEVSDNIPDGLVFDAQDETNVKYGWVMYDKDGNITTDANNAVKIKTDYLSKEKSQARSEDALINAIDTANKKIYYKDIKAVFTVSATSSNKVITNIAEISNDSDENGDEIDDDDSTPGNSNEKEDDLDTEKVKLGNFDLSLQKFITGLNNNSITNREPKVTYENGKLSFSHTQTPLEVNTADIVTYTIRVYNEGNIAGYASEVCDDIPSGLVFDTTNAVNQKYGWTMYDKDGNVVTDASKAVKIKTDYLSKAKSQARNESTLLKGFDSEKGTLCYYDLKAVFVVSTTSKNETVVNTAEITEDTDENGNQIDDNDSTPNNGSETEDDLDKERIHIGYFDLALKKDLSKAIITENGKTKEVASKDNELFKVEIKKKNLNSTIVKFVYNISVTNEGTIPGYVTGIKDYIPEGLEFVASDNSADWSSPSNGVIENASLAKTIIQPGETKTVQVILRWTNNENNLGLKKNVAEISSDYNDANDVDDIDSVPDNKKDEEDDIDSAEVILAISTGLEENNIIFIILSIMIIASGAVLIRKYVYKIQ